MKVINGQEEFNKFSSTLKKEYIPYSNAKNMVVFKNILIMNVNSFTDYACFKNCVIDKCGIGDLHYVYINGKTIFRNCSHNRHKLVVYSSDEIGSSCEESNSLVMVNCDLNSLNIIDGIKVNIFNSYIESITDTRTKLVNLYHSKIQELPMPTEFVTRPDFFHDSEIKVLLVESQDFRKLSDLAVLWNYVGKAKKIVMHNIRFFSLPLKYMNFNDFEFYNCTVIECNVSGSDFSKCKSSRNYEIKYKKDMSDRFIKYDLRFVDGIVKDVNFGSAVVEGAIDTEGNRDNKGLVYVTFNQG